MYQHRVLFWNEGQLPDSWTVEHLTRKHPSKPFNPDIANTLFRAGYIESWGRGTIKMITECQKYQLTIPWYHFDASGIVVEFFRYTEAGLREKGMKEKNSLRSSCTCRKTAGSTTRGYNNSVT